MDASAWDDRYRGTDHLWSVGPNSFLADRFAGSEPGRGLDLACGEGRNAVWLAEQGWDMVAVDFSEVAIGRGRDRYPDVDWIVSDVLTWEPEPSDEPFDLIVVAYLQIEAEPLAELITRSIDWLAAGGEMFLIGHALSNLEEGVGGPQVPERLWDLDLMLEWVQPLSLVEGGIVKREVEVDGEVRHALDVLIRARRA